MNNKRVPPSVAQFAVSERAELLARITEQAREIERLRLNIAEYNEHERCYQAEIAALKAQPRGVVPPTKAQGVVMPERWNVPRPMWKDARQPYGNPLNHADIEAAEKFNLALDEVARLNAAPAAPAADAGIVDMYRHLQKVTPYRFKKIQDASITDGGDVMYFHKDRFDAALLADMAAHCAAKGVV